MTMKRPPHLKPPAHWANSPPAPEPKAVPPAPEPEPGPDRTRYGDWERKGIAVDF